MKSRFSVSFLVILAFQVSSAWAEQQRIIVRQGEQIRAVILQKEGESLLFPMFACEALLDAEVSWDRATNRWEIVREDVTARGFLDEPLLFISGKPLLVKNPPRLIDGAPYISMESLRILARHGWGAEIIWDEGIQELTVREALAAPADTIQRVRAITVPEVPAGARAIVLDAGHPRHGGVRVTGGIAEGDAGLQLARAVSATLSSNGSFFPVVLQGEGEGLDPSEVASVVNALQAEIFVSFHLSTYGIASIALWCWSREDILKTGVDFDPFEKASPDGAGWISTAQTHFKSSDSLARSMISGAEGVSIPIDGPFLAPLLCLEGINCPAVAVDIQGASTPAGVSFLQDEEAIAVLADSIAHAIIEQLQKERP